MKRLLPVIAAAGTAALLAACVQPEPTKPTALNHVGPQSTAGVPAPAPVQVVAPQPVVMAPPTVMAQPVMVPPGTPYVVAVTNPAPPAQPGNDCLRYTAPGIGPQSYWCVAIATNGDLYTGDWRPTSNPFYNYQRRYTLNPPPGANSFAIRCNDTNWCVGSDNMGGTYSGDVLLTATEPTNANAFRRRS